MGLIDGLLPRKIAVYNGVAVRNKGWHERKDEYPFHKSTLVNAIKEVIRHDDRVVHIGGGKGIAPTWTARWAINGLTVVYEPAAEMVDIMRNVRKLNAVDFDIVHAHVGPVIESYGSIVGSDWVGPNELQGDLAVLDCEGAEREILPLPQFDRVVVESHPAQDSTTKTVRDIMDGQTYISGEDEIDGDVVVRV